MDRRVFLASLALPVGARAAIPGSAGGSDASGDYSVRNFGARGDGKTNDTAAV